MDSSSTPSSSAPVSSTLITWLRWAPWLPVVNTTTLSVSAWPSSVRVSPMPKRSTCIEPRRVTVKRSSPSLWAVGKLAPTVTVALP